MENKLLGWNKTPKLHFFLSSLTAGTWKGLLPASAGSWKTDYEPLPGFLIFLTNKNKLP